MVDLGRITIIVYGVLMLVGGVMGYVTKQSKPSLIAGIVSGVLLLVAYLLTRTQPKAGLGLGALVAVALIVVFIRRLQQTGAFMPSGMLCIVSLIAALLMGAAMLKAGG